MKADDPRLALLRDNVKFAVRQLGEARGEPLGFDRDSVAWVEGFIERNRRKYADENARAGMVSVLGSYLGQAIIEAAGAAWDEDADGALGVRFANGDWCYPFNKVDKQFAQGLEGGESILSFYNVCLDVVANGQLGACAGGAEQL